MIFSWASMKKKYVFALVKCKSYDAFFSIPLGKDPKLLKNFFIFENNGLLKAV